MLEGENGCGRENRDLLAVGDGFEGRAHGYFRFSVPDIAAEEAVHRSGALHVALDVGDGGVLVGGFFEFEGVFEFSLEIAVGGKCKTLGCFASGIEGEELIRHVFEGFADAGFARIPAGAA